MPCKVVSVQTMNAHMVNRGTALHIINPGIGWRSVVNRTPWPHSWERTPVPSEKENRRVPGLVLKIWKREKSLTSVRIRTPDHPVQICYLVPSVLCPFSKINALSFSGMNYLTSPQTELTFRRRIKSRLPFAGIILHVFRIRIKLRLFRKSQKI